MIFTIRKEILNTYANDYKENFIDYVMWTIFFTALSILSFAIIPIDIFLIPFYVAAFILKKVDDKK